MPTMASLNTEGLDMSDADVEELLRVDNDEWRKEVPLIREHFATFGDRLPDSLLGAVDDLEQRLS